MRDRPAVLLVGESWMSTGTHVKGFNHFFTGFYEEGHAALSAALSQEFAVQHMPGHLASTNFPDDRRELERYRAVLFSDIGADTLLLHPKTFLHSEVCPNRLKVIQAYVEHGGGFGMIGGYMSFAGMEGKARYHRTPIETILPVDILPYDDRAEVPEGFAPQYTGTEHPAVATRHAEWPLLLGYNILKPKEAATVLLRHGDDPILTVRNFGQGRTMAFASDCAPHWGSPRFVAWEHYATFWLGVVRWLSGLSG
ncbi:MAG: cytoplasmic protein [Caldilineaceae bacterium]|nr:cytoplasmic protein [Caldilineaceae bacterium]